MSQLNIFDLNFCDNVLASNNEVQGGNFAAMSVVIQAPNGMVSASVAAGINGVVKVYPANHNYVITAQGSGAVAGAAAGAVSDGPNNNAWTMASVIV